VSERESFPSFAFSFVISDAPGESSLMVFISKTSCQHKASAFIIILGFSGSRRKDYFGCGSIHSSWAGEFVFRLLDIIECCYELLIRQRVSGNPAAFAMRYSLLLPAAAPMFLAGCMVNSCSSSTHSCIICCSRIECHPAAAVPASPVLSS